MAAFSILPIFDLCLRDCWSLLSAKCVKKLKKDIYNLCYIGLNNSPQRFCWILHEFHGFFFVPRKPGRFFFNLQCLWPQLKKLLTELLEEVRQAPLPAGAGFHQALEVNLQVLVAQTQRVPCFLDEIVQSKVDPVSHKTFQSVLEASNVNSLTSHFWAELVGVFKAKFAKVCQDRAFRAKAVSDCPKVLQTLVLAVEKLGRGKIMKAAERETLFQSAADLRNEYLGAEWMEKLEGWWDYGKQRKFQKGFEITWIWDNQRKSHWVGAWHQIPEKHSFSFHAVKDLLIPSVC